MRNGEFEGILSAHWFTHPFSDLLETFLSDIIKFVVDVHNILLFFFSTLDCFGTLLEFGQSINFSLHSIDLKSTGYVLLDFGLIDLTKEVQILSIILLMGIKPIKG